MEGKTQIRFEFFIPLLCLCNIAYKLWSFLEILKCACDKYEETNRNITKKEKVGECPDIVMKNVSLWWQRWHLQSRLKTYWVNSGFQVVFVVGSHCT